MYGPAVGQVRPSTANLTTLRSICLGLLFETTASLHVEPGPDQRKVKTRASPIHSLPQETNPVTSPLSPLISLCLSKRCIPPLTPLLYNVRLGFLPSLFTGSGGTTQRLHTLSTKADYGHTMLTTRSSVLIKVTKRLRHLPAKQSPGGFADKYGIGKQRTGTMGVVVLEVCKLKEVSKYWILMMTDTPSNTNSCLPCANTHVSRIPSLNHILYVSFCNFLLKIGCSAERHIPGTGK